MRIVPVTQQKDKGKDKGKSYDIDESYDIEMRKPPRKTTGKGKEKEANSSFPVFVKLLSGKRFTKHSVERRWMKIH